MVSILSPCASSQVLPEIEMSLSPLNQEVDASSSDGYAKINGTINITGLPLVTYTVNITADAEDWETSVEPSQLRLRNGESGNFVVTVIVPMGALGGLKKVVSVNATATFIGGRTSTTSWANVTSKQIFSFTVEQSDDELTITSNKSETVIITVKNTGNGPDSFTLKLLDVRSLIEKGLRVRSNRSIISLMPSASGSIAVSFTSTDKALSGDYTFKMKVYSRTAKRYNQTVEQEISVILHTKVEDKKIDNEKKNDEKKTHGFTSALLIASLILIYIRRRW